MDDTVLVHLEVDLTGLHFCDGLADLHGDGAGFRVRHQSAGTEDLTQGTNFRHHARHGDDDVHVGPTFLDLIDVFLQAHIVSASCLCLFLLVGSAEDQNAHYLTCAVREGNDTSHHLVGLTGVNTQTDVNIEGCIELGVSDAFYDIYGFSERVGLVLIKLGKRFFAFL